MPFKAEPGARRYPVGALLLCAAAALYLGYHFRESLIPFALSFALAYLANPVINVFEARGLRREHIVAVMYLLIVISIFTAANFLLPTTMRELSLLQAKAPVYFARAQEFLLQLQSDMARRLPVGQNLVERWSLQMYHPVVEYVQRVPGYLLGLFPLLSLIFLVPFISIFMLMDTSRFLRQAIQTCPARHVEQALHLLTETDISLGNYVRGILTEAFLIGATSFLGLLALGVDYALAIGVLAGVSNLVPYAGPILGAAVAGSVALFQFRSLWAVASVLVLFAGIRLADDMLLQPFISRHSVRLHPLVYLLALMIGAQAFGFVGLLLGVPAACIVKALVSVAWEWYSTETGLKPPEPVPAARIPYV